MEDFYSSILKNIEEVKNEIDTEIKNILYDVSTILIQYSPKPSGTIEYREPEYSMGLFANQWYYTFDNPSSELSAETDYSGGGSFTRAKAIKTRKRIENDFSYYAINNTEYSDKVEYLGWQFTSPYAPVGKSVSYITSKYR